MASMIHSQEWVGDDTGSNSSVTICANAFKYVVIEINLPHENSKNAGIKWFHSRCGSWLLCHCLA